MDNRARRKPYIDVMENVFGGVRISTEDERRARTVDRDFRARPWLAGLTMSAVDVRLVADDDSDKDH